MQKWDKKMVIWRLLWSQIQKLMIQKNDVNIHNVDRKKKRMYVLTMNKKRRSIQPFLPNSG
jgi:hypothetical protein